MELDKDKKESWIFAVREGLYDFSYKARYTSDQAVMAQHDEVMSALHWIEQELIPKPSEEKIALMQRKDLLHQLYILTKCGSQQLSPEECLQVADMILRRKGKEDYG
jgi:hypothetical protein|tara:strand:- start:7 stop:327 length:321 start_codon:yes stop_codon:yes gene_type:complete